MIWPWDLRERSLEPEILDRERVSREMMVRVVGYLDFVNCRLLGIGPVARHFDPAAGPVTVLDVAAGAGSLGRELARVRPQVRTLALDHSLDILTFASDLPRVRGDAFRLPIRDRGVDWVITSLFFHHLTDDQVVAVLREFDRVARRGIVVSDLVRRWRAWCWIKLLALWANPVVKVDGPLSVRKAFTVAEIAALAQRAGLGWLQVRTHFGHRFTLAGERGKA